MTVTYIYHSGFMIETQHLILIFDYYKDPSDIVRRTIDHCDKPVYFFVSHRHPDHFNPAIFNFASQNSPIRYIISADVRKKLKHMEVLSSIDFLKVGESYADNWLTVLATPSTDVGVSFCVSIEDASIFHAGDLNDWHWKDESTQKEINKAEGDFKSALNKIHEAGFSQFKIAMFPVDPRMGSDFEEGAKMFVREFEVEHFFPMHFWDKSVLATKFSRYRTASGEYHALTKPGECITID